MSSPDFYLNATKQAILVTYCNEFYGRVPSDQFVDTLNRVFSLKQKAFKNIATYVQREVEVRGKPLDQTLVNISFFANILVEYIDRDGNQPIKKS
ncbi:hypothetical protein E3A20_20700 [Planctomyces bekefii]|uniref:Uncharacterized protein n=1 Tax=Planctomyces bekefii TaxID=1653850 RepID=A0A5C6M3W4_9PLAN|nr:hypothetical protein E3A20_20700 [Planctomyces bekefii]